MIYKIGDTITIIKPEVINKNGRFNWSDEMDDIVGKEFEIKEVDDSGYYRCNTPKFRWCLIEEWIEDPILTLINEVTK